MSRFQRPRDQTWKRVCNRLSPNALQKPECSYIGHRGTLVELAVGKWRKAAVLVECITPPSRCGESGFCARIRPRVAADRNWLFCKIQSRAIVCLESQRGVRRVTDF